MTAFIVIGVHARGEADIESYEGYSHFIIGKLKHQIHILKVVSTANYEN